MYETLTAVAEPYGPRPPVGGGPAGGARRRPRLGPLGPRWTAATLIAGLSWAAAGAAAGHSQAPPKVQLDPGIELTRLDDHRRQELLGTVRRWLETGDPPEATRGELPAATRLVLSLSREQAPALVATGRGPSLSSALKAAGPDLRHRASEAEITRGRIKIDVATARSRLIHFDVQGRSRVDRSLQGLWLPGPDLLLLPDELLSRRLVHSDGDLQTRRLRDYLRAGGRPAPGPDEDPGRPGRPYRTIDFDSFVEGPAGEAVRLYRGNPREPGRDPAALLRAVRAGTEYLLRHQRADGSFEYRYQPKWDAYDDGENLLRQAGTSYAMIETFRRTRDERYLRAARRALFWVLERARPPRDDRADFLAIVSPGEEAKLGGAALVLLGLVEHQRATGDARFLDTARALARFLVHQQEVSGRFHSKYFYGPPDATVFESIYYPGEAILALLRLHEIDPDPVWLATARRGADWLIDVRDADKGTASLPHDHWLLMGLAELDDRVDDPKYLGHASRIADSILAAQRTRSTRYPDWVGSFYDPPRSTPTATRAEALVAMHRLAERHDIDPTPYREALLLMAEFQLRHQLTVENSFYLPRPDRALGGFRRSLTTWEVRIDYVQHNVSALLGLRDILLATSPGSGSASSGAR